MMKSDLKDLHKTKNKREKSLTMPRDIAPVIERLTLRRTTAIVTIRGEYNENVITFAEFLY